MKVKTFATFNARGNENEKAWPHTFSSNLASHALNLDSRLNTFLEDVDVFQIIPLPYAIMIFYTEKKENPTNETH